MIRLHRSAWRSLSCRNQFGYVERRMGTRSSAMTRCGFSSQTSREPGRSQTRYWARASTRPSSGWLHGGADRRRTMLYFVVRLLARLGPEWTRRRKTHIEPMMPRRARSTVGQAFSHTAAARTVEVALGRVHVYAGPQGNLGYQHRMARDSRAPAIRVTLAWWRPGTVTPCRRVHGGRGTRSAAGT